MCPLLTCAAGKARPCARERCEWWVESFDARYSACAVLALASNSGKTLGLVKRVVRGMVGDVSRDLMERYPEEER